MPAKLPDEESCDSIEYGLAVAHTGPGFNKDRILVLQGIEGDERFIFQCFGMRTKHRMFSMRTTTLAHAGRIRCPVCRHSESVVSVLVRAKKQADAARRSLICGKLMAESMQLQLAGKKPSTREFFDLLAHELTKTT